VSEGISRTFQMVRPFYQLPAYKNLIVPLYSPRVKKLAGGKYGIGTPWPWICWKRWGLNGMPT
jgi:ABC-type branched-subunit amino acid transport system ATPase component